MLEVGTNLPSTVQPRGKKRKRPKKNMVSVGAPQSGEEKKKARKESKIRKLTAELLLMNDPMKADSCLHTLNLIKGNSLESNISQLSSAIKDMPSVTLQATGISAQLAIPEKQRTPLQLADLRNMIQVSFLPMNVERQLSHWCQVKRRSSQLVIVIVEGITPATFSDLGLDRNKVKKYYQQLYPTEKRQHDSVDEAKTTLDSSPTNNGEVIAKKQKKNKKVSTSNSLSLKGSPIKNLDNTSSIITISPDTESVDSSFHSKLPTSNHSDLYNTVSTWLPACCSRYSNAVEFNAPGLYGRHVEQDLLLMRISRKRIQRIHSGLEKAPASLKEQEAEETLYGRLTDTNTNTDTNANVSSSEEASLSTAYEMIHERFEITTEISELPVDTNHWGRNNHQDQSKKNDLKEDNFDRRKLLVSFPDLFSERYPLPQRLYLAYKDIYIPAHKIISERTELCYKKCVPSKPVYAKVRPESPMFGLDCEFVFTTGNMSSLGSISVVSEAGELLYHTLVKPKETIIDYATRWSGLTEKMLRNVTTTVTDVREHLKRHLPPDAILVGHSLATDLRVMEMYHPYVVDTSLLYNMSGFKGNRSKLKTLTKTFLHRDIQMVEKRTGHDPTEDAEATLQLVQLKLQHDYSFGNVMIQGSMLSLKDSTQASPPSHEKFFNMFEFLEEYAEQSRQLPTSKPVHDKYEVLCPPSLSPQWSSTLHGLTNPSAPKVMDDNSAVIDSFCSTAMLNDVTIAHLEADPRLMSSKVKPRLAALSDLDDQLSRVFDAAANKALCCVIFSGAPPPEASPSAPITKGVDRQQNGMFFFEIKGASSRQRKTAVRRLSVEASDE